MLDQVLSIGLSLVGIVEARQHRQSRKRNIDDYKSYFGFKPVIHAQLWEDLQTTDIVEARIDITTPKGNVSIENLLWSQYFLKTYCTDKQRKGPTGHCEEMGRKWCWHFLDKIQALKADKVSVCASNTLKAAIARCHQLLTISSLFGKKMAALILLLWFCNCKSWSCGGRGVLPPCCCCCCITARRSRICCSRCELCNSASARSCSCRRCNNKVDSVP